MSKGKKFDQGKPDLSLIPKVALDKCAEAFMIGEKKYGRYNYTSGLEASRQLAAAMRHLSAWFNGEESDPVDGQHHLGAAMACCAMILREQELGTLIDDRYTPPDPWEGIDDYVEYKEGGPIADYVPPTDVTDFAVTLPESAIGFGLRFRIACRRPDGAELVSLKSWATQTGAVTASDEYTKQYPQCTFLAYDAHGN